MKTIIIVLLYTFYSVSVYCCSCIGESKLKSAIKSSDYIFIGSVIDINHKAVVDTFIVDELDSLYFLDTMYVNEITFRIVTLYKGKKRSEEIKIITGLGSGDCGFEFDNGKEYIVYSYYQYKPDAYDEKTRYRFLYTDICSRTRLSTSGAEVKVLNEIFRK